MNSWFWVYKEGKLVTLSFFGGMWRLCTKTMKSTFLFDGWLTYLVKHIYSPKDLGLLRCLVKDEGISHCKDGDFLLESKLLAFQRFRVYILQDWKFKSPMLFKRYFDGGGLQIRGYRLWYWTKLKMKRNLSIMFEGWTLKVTSNLFLTRSLFAKFQAMNACTWHWRWRVKQELKEVPLWQSLMERIDERFSKKNTVSIWVVSETNDAS